MRTLDPQKNRAQRAKIMEKSRSLFARKGFAETSMSEIGQACKLTKPALYHYFRSKEEILSSLFEETWAETEAQISKLPKSASLKDLLLLTGQTYLDHMDDARHVELCKITIKETSHNSVVHKKSLSFVQPRMEKKILAIFGPFFKKKISPREIQLFACQFFGSLFYYTFIDKLMGEGAKLPASPKRYLESLADIFSKQAN